MLVVELLGSCKLICVPLLVCESANTDLLLLGTFSVGGLAYDVYSGPGQSHSLQCWESVSRILRIESSCLLSNPALHYPPLHATIHPCMSQVKQCY